MIAVEELKNKLKDIQKKKEEIKCAVIGMSYKFPRDDVELILTNPIEGRNEKPLFEKITILKENWTNEDWYSFIKDLAFDYDNGYGTQLLFGKVWFKDGTWLERDEYDGSEWWEYKSVPTIPIGIKGECFYE